MKDISSLLSGINLNKTDDDYQIDDMQNNEIEDIANFVMSEIQGICGAWKQSWPTQEIFDNAKKQWVLALIDNGITSYDQIEAGLARLRHSDCAKELNTAFIPSIPMFMSWCKQPEKLVTPQHLTMDWDGVQKWDDKPTEEKDRLRELAKSQLKNILGRLKG
ncbi:MAG: replication protein P [Shewanella sp.]